MIKWRIYYGDHSTFDSLMGEPEDAPSTNVQCVSLGKTETQTDAMVEEMGHAVVHSWQYYMYKEGMGWFGIFTDFDLVDHFMADAHLIRAVCKARTIPIADYKKIFSKACNDPDFPIKTAWKEDVEAPWQNGIFDKRAIK